MDFKNKYPQILICSASYEQSVWLIEKLSSKYNKNTEIKEEISKTKKYPSGFHIFESKLFVETKYFEAFLEIVIAQYDFFQNAEEAKEFCAPSELFHSIEGIIFIDDPHHIHHNIYQQITKYFNPSMQVIFRDISQNKSEKQIEEDFSESEIFIETVYENFSQIEIEPEKKTGLLKEETEGLMRILEIIECTMWSQMRKIKRPKPNQISDSEVKKEEESKPEVKTKEAIDEKHIEDNSKEKTLVESKQKTKPNDIDENDNEEDMEKNMDAFVDLLQEMKDARKDIKNLNDQERKQKAEDLFYKLMSVCKDMGDDEDEDEKEILND